MNRYIYLIKNIGLLTLSNFATKLLSFFLVPLYTNILTTTDYGTYDLFETTINMLIPILTLNIQEAVLRFSLEKEYNRSAIVSISIKSLLLSCGIVILGLITNGIFSFSPAGKEYAVFFFLMFLIRTLSGIVLAYIRGIDKIYELSISSVIASIVTIGCNIIFLAVFKWGLIGYFLANILGPFVQCFYLLIKSNMMKDMHLRARYDHEREEMIRYSAPMMANSIAWWVNNSSDRYVVIFFCGLAENGIYSVASKIPSILNLVQTIFNQAWTLSAVKDFDPEDRNGFFSNTYKAYNCFLVVACSIIIVVDKILAKFLYAKDFYAAWRYVPWLTIAIVFGALSGYIGGFFSAVKDSKIYAQSTIVGAVINIILNLLFTPLIGALGAAIATTISYIIVWIIRYWHSKKFVRMQINLKRDIVTYSLLIVQAILLLLISEDWILYLVEIGSFMLIIFLYMKDITVIINRLYNKIKERQ